MAINAYYIQTFKIRRQYLEHIVTYCHCSFSCYNKLIHGNEMLQTIVFIYSRRQLSMQGWYRTFPKPFPPNAILLIHHHVLTLPVAAPVQSVPEPIEAEVDEDEGGAWQHHSNHVIRIHCTAVADVVELGLHGYHVTSGLEELVVVSEANDDEDVESVGDGEDGHPGQTENDDQLGGADTLEDLTPSLPRWFPSERCDVCGRTWGRWTWRRWRGRPRSCMGGGWRGRTGRNDRTLGMIGSGTVPNGTPVNKCRDVMCVLPNGTLNECRMSHDVYSIAKWIWNGICVVYCQLAHLWLIILVGRYLLPRNVEPHYKSIAFWVWNWLVYMRTILGKELVPTKQKQRLR